MSDKNVFIWSAFGDNKGFPLGGQESGKNVDDNLFIRGLSIDDAYQVWINSKGFKAAMNGTHSFPEYKDEVKRTLDWYEKRHPLSYVSEFSKEELEELDTFELSLMIPFGNQKVVDILNTVCPNDVEAFPIEIHTPTGILNNFYLLNITNKIQNALDKPNCKYSLASFKKEGEEDSISGSGSFTRILFNKGCMNGLGMGRLYEDLGRVMLDKAVVDAFVKEKIYGFNVEIFEDRLNGHYTSNYMPDGKTLKV